MVQLPDQVIAQKYQLVRRLARGGMGAVWLARHLQLQSEVALKFLRADQGRDEQAEDRFRREARAAAQLKSPYVVQIHDFGVDSGTPYIAMELLRGEDLRTRLDREGALPIYEAAEILVQIAKGLAEAHEVGIVHRDIKPSNIFLTQSAGEIHAKVLDFGIAKATLVGGGEATTQGQVFGSPAYMSPEQARAGRVDGRSDLWSLGAVFYEMLTGSAPFGGSSPSDIVVKICTEDARPPSKRVPILGEDVDRFFRHALARDVDQRFATAEEMMRVCASWIAPRGHSGETRSGGSDASSPLGRVDETAPLSQRVRRDVNEGGGSDPVTPSRSTPSLRPSLLPERPQHSYTRGVVAVGGLLLILGVVGILMNRGHRERRQLSSPAASSTNLSRPMGSTTEPPHKKAGAPAGTTTEGRETHVPPASEREPGSSEAPARIPTRPSPRPGASPSQKVPLKPTPDPVFGLPVESP